MRKRLKKKLHTKNRPILNVELINKFIWRQFKLAEQSLDTIKDLNDYDKSIRINTEGE